MSAKDGRFVLDVGERLLRARQVVVATGPFQLPRTPGVADSMAPDVIQIHSIEYQRPSEIPSGVVLVVGGGNTGYQIAQELSGHPPGPPRCGHPPDAASPTPIRPRRVLVPVQAGLSEKSVDSRLGRGDATAAATP